MTMSSHYEDLQLTPLPDTAPGYAKARVGPGRWFILQAPAGRQVGVVWTDDREGLGFVDLPGDEINYSQIMWSNLQAMAEAGLPATAAFDGLARSDTLAVMAEGVESGDLQDIPALR